jgi:hypothetical protein
MTPKEERARIYNFPTFGATFDRREIFLVVETLLEREQWFEVTPVPNEEEENTKRFRVTVREGEETNRMRGR